MSEPFAYWLCVDVDPLPDEETGFDSLAEASDAIRQRWPAAVLDDEWSTESETPNDDGLSASPWSLGSEKRWSRVRGVAKLTKRYLIAAAGHNLGRILFKLFGVGKPKALQGSGCLAALVQLVILQFQRVCETISPLRIVLEPPRTNRTA